MGRALGVTFIVALWCVLAAALFWAARDLAPRMFPTEAAAYWLSEEDKAAIYRKLAHEHSGLYEAVPEAKVGKLLQRRIEKHHKGTVVQTNNAGLRSRRRYTAKEPGVFRVVCLGDSFTEGTAGAEEDRYCDQLEDLLGATLVEPAAERVEALAIGVGSWNALNSATYLAHRISAYEPDIILALIVRNDISDTQGVSGVGTSANNFTPEARDLGSAVFPIMLPRYFGHPGYSWLRSDLCPECRRRWRATFEAYAELERLQHTRGGRLLLGSLRIDPYFDELVRKQAADAGITSPILLLDFLGEHLPHDGHPNRRGHEHLANHYLRAIDALGWVRLDTERLPPLPDSLSLEEMRREPDEERLRVQRERTVAQLPRTIDFRAIDASDAPALLGGIWPDEAGGGAPFGTLKSAFLLGRAEDSTTLRVTIELPARPELYPTELTLLVNDEVVLRRTLETQESAGTQVLEASLEGVPESFGALEVKILTDSYWGEIDDSLMRSYRLIEARQE